MADGLPRMADGLPRMADGQRPAKRLLGPGSRWRLVMVSSGVAALEVASCPAQTGALRAPSGATVEAATAARFVAVVLVATPGVAVLPGECGPERRLRRQ